MQIARRPNIRHRIREFSYEHMTVKVQPCNSRFKNCGPIIEVPVKEITAFDTGWDDHPRNICWTPVSGFVEYPKMPGRVFARTHGGPPGDVLADIDATA